MLIFLDSNLYAYKSNKWLTISKEKICVQPQGGENTLHTWGTKEPDDSAHDNTNACSYPQPLSCCL